MSKNKLTNTKIFVVTDDDSFNMSQTELTNTDYSVLHSNQFNVIKI
jgi:hypothetical protein